MDDDRYSTWNAPPPIPLGDSPPSNEMPQTGVALGMPDLNFTPEDRSFNEEPSNPQHGTSNPQTGVARGMPDLNFTPEDRSFNEEPSNPQHGTSNPQHGTSNPQHGTSNPQHGPSNPQHGTSNSEGALISPEHSPPDINIYRVRVVNRPPKPFFRGKVAEAFEGMKKFLVKIRRRSKPKKEGGVTIRKYTRLGKPKSEDGTKRKKPTPGDDEET